MFNEIIDAIERRLEDKMPADNIDIKDFRVIKNTSFVYTQPGIYVFIDDGTSQITTANDSDRLTPVVNIVVKFKHLKREDERRKGVYPIIEGIIGALERYDLTDADGNPLKVRSLRLMSFRNITLPVEDNAGFILYQIQFKLSYTITKMDDEQVTELLTMGVNYYLQPNNDTPVATDVITLKEEQ